MNAGTMETGTSTPPLRVTLVQRGASAEELAAYDAGYARAMVENAVYRARVGNQREEAGECRACGRSLEDET